MATDDSQTKTIQCVYCGEDESPSEEIPRVCDLCGEELML